MYLFDEYWFHTELKTVVLKAMDIKLEEKQEGRFMRILVFSQAAWNTTNSFGNTFTNWFDGWNDVHFFHFYARHQKPNTNIVEMYYNVSAIEILKKGFVGKQAGRILTTVEVDESAKMQTIEQAQITKLHNGSHEIVYWAMERVWLSKKWINKTFDEFVEYADPDIIFAYAANPYILEPALKHIREKKDVKTVLWIADDVLAQIDQYAWYRRRYLRKGISYCFSIADKLYGASIEMCEKYSRTYGKEVTPLYKGCSFDKPCKERINSPLRLAYAGNLLYGRLDTIKVIINALKVINSNGCKAVLEVYSNTPVNLNEKKQLFDDINAFYMGVRPYEEIKGILNKADIVLHVESFEKEQIEAVKYSFSTKIIDCLQSGSPVMGIGPSGIASIEYLRKVDGALVIDDPSYINGALSDLINEQGSLVDRARDTREYAIENHEIHRVRQRLHNDFYDLINHTR